MKYVAGLVGMAVLAGACTEPNPRSCTDGTCTDPGLPFCDTDGRMSGTPGTCIAVSCTAGVFDSCRGDIALVCNPRGTSFDLVSCPQSCEDGAGGCVGCTGNTECPVATSPVCDLGSHTCVGCLVNGDCGAALPVCETTTHTCRTCRADSECASELCDEATGTCVDAASIVYASPIGGGGACGTQTAPCSLTVALTLIDATHRIIKMQSGAYSGSDLSVIGTNVELHGAGATLTATTGSVFRLSGNANLLVDGLEITHTGSSNPFAVTASGGPTATKVNLVGVRLMTGQQMIVANYALTIDRSTMDLATGPAPSITLQTNAQLVVRRSFLNHGGISVDQSRFSVSNAVFVNSSNSAISILNTNGGNNDVSFTTFINSPIDQNTAFPIVTLSNCLFFGVNAVQTNVVTGNAFTLHYALLNPQSAAPAGSDHVLLNADPKFVSPAGSNYHLMVGSPAIDAADPTAMTPDDFDGNPRPVGAARDLGAFEYKP